MVDRDFNEAAKRRKGEKIRQEREQQERDRQREEQREAAKRRPHCEGSMTPTERRIIARAERHQQILAQIRAGNYSSAAKPTAQARWNAAVESAVAECGGDRRRAVTLANRTNPGLREQMLAEVNGR